MVKRVAPLSFEAWIDYGLGAASLSLPVRKILQNRIRVGDG